MYFMEIWVLNVLSQKNRKKSLFLSLRSFCSSGEYYKSIRHSRHNRFFSFFKNKISEHGSACLLCQHLKGTGRNIRSSRPISTTQGFQGQSILNEALSHKTKQNIIPIVVWLFKTDFKYCLYQQQASQAQKQLGQTG